MSVYTRVEQEHMEALLADFGLTLDTARPATHGIENSTFLIHARDRDGQEQHVVLTVFEQFNAQTLAPYLDLLAALAWADLPVPAALIDGHGRRLHDLAGKPAVLVPRLPGVHVFKPEVEHCRQVGEFLARLHRQPAAAARPLLNERQRLTGFAHHLGRLGDDEALRARQVMQRWDDLPAGKTLIHGDLFRDNVLFNGDERLSGVLDFYNACVERPEYDLAVALNDWAVASDGRPVPRREAALLAGYRDADGHWNPDTLNLALAVAALRYWLSRLEGPVSGESEGQGSKDPAEFGRIFGYRFNALSTSE